MAPWAAANAALLDLRGSATVDDYGDPTGLGTAIWEGEHADTVLVRARETVVSGGENTPVETDILIVRKPPDVVATARMGDESVGFTVLVEDRRTAAKALSRFRLAKAEHRGVGEAESVRFELVDEEIVEAPGSGSGS